MLILRASRTGPHRLIVAGIHHLDKLQLRAFALASAPQQLSRRSQSLGRSTLRMLRIAAEEHARSQVTSSQSHASSRSFNSASRDPLNQTSASLLNRPKNGQFYGRSEGGTKRTTGGLAKSLSGSFEEGFGSQAQPYVVNDRTPVKGATSSFTSVDLFDENDFDSDIELEIEQPKPLKHVTYPKLPQQPPKSAQFKQAFYPTLPKQQQAQQSIVPDDELPQGPAWSPAISKNAKDLDSSAPLPWSSSPVEQRSFRLPGTTKRIALDAGNGQSAPVARSTNDVGTSKPPRKRLLPWTEDNEDESPAPAPPNSIAQKHSTTSGAGMFTPRTKPQQKIASLWNTSASAVKEQQKQHREEAKRAIRQPEEHEEVIQKAQSTLKRPALYSLSDEQKHVLDLVVEKKKSVFFTGSAGTGKSVLMREIISTLRKRFIREPDRVAVTASTGLAACNVGGVTLHSFAGIGLGKEDVPELVRKIKRNQKAKHRWMRTKVLVVDEVSMVDGDLFDKLEAIARQIRNNARPFGGIQLVITGDFFQLPPVPDKSREAKFAFDAATWRTSVEYTIALHHVFRQKDPVFAGMLNEMREGRLSESSIKAFRNLSRPLNFEDMLDATELFPTRAEVDRANAERLHMLQGSTCVYLARDGGTIVDKAQRDRLLQNCMAPESMTLKKGAQVMLIKNVDENLVNGSIGRIIGFFTEAEFDRYDASDEGFSKSPGGTIQSTPGDSSSADPRRVTGGITTNQGWPLVRFPIADGTSRELLCQPEAWKIELPNGEVQASRTQVPLILAWSLSIHKAQGQTLERVKVDLGKVFEKGQAYVALSRATSMAGLQVLRFDPKKVNAHERVRTFYANLSRVELENQSKDRSEKTVKKGGMAEDYERQFLDGELGMN